MQSSAWKLTASLLVGAGLAGAATAQPMTRGGRPVGAPHPSELFGQWFGAGGKSKPAPAKKETKAVAAKPKAVAEKPVVEDQPAEKPADRFQREQRAFLRRVAVCDRLRQIALQTNDDALLRRADELQEQAWSICLERTGMTPVDDLETSAADEEILEQRLGGAESRATKVDRLYTVPGATRMLAQEEEP